MTRRNLAVVQPVKGRECGPCTACCGTGIIIDEPDFQKPYGVPCQHRTPNGCGIYESRYKVCREFYCLWRYGMLEVEDRPNQSGVVFGNPQNDLGAYVVFETYPGSLEAEPAIRLFDRLMQEGHAIIKVVGSKRALLAPPGHPARQKLMATLARRRTEKP